MVVILNEDDYDAWLHATKVDSQNFLRQFPTDHLLAQHPRQSFLCVPFVSGSLYHRALFQNASD